MTYETGALEACGLWVDGCRRRAVEEAKAAKTVIREKDRELANLRKSADWAQKHPVRLLVRKMGRELSRPFRHRPTAPPHETAPPKMKLTKAERLKKERLERLQTSPELESRWQDLGVALDPAEIEFLLDRASVGQRWMWLSPSPRALAVALLLSVKGCDVTVAGCPKWMRKLGNEHLSFSEVRIVERLRHESEYLASYEAIGFDATHADLARAALATRLWPRQSVLEVGVTDTPSAENELGYSQSEKSLRWYACPPGAWLHPDWPWDARQDSSAWPRVASLPVDFPDLMPSGRPWPKITVVTVTRNQAEFFPATLESVLSQGYPNLEYLVLDGASTDETPRILLQHAPRLAYAVSERDEGQADALNNGFGRSTGEIMTWLNSDDRHLPDTLRRVALSFDEHPDADLIAGGCALIHGRNPFPRHIHHCRLPHDEVSVLPLEKLLDVDGHWLAGDFFFQPEVFWRRSIWEKTQSKVRKDLYYSMDYELWVRFAAAGARILPIRQSLVLFRLHEAQKTHGADEPFVPELRRINAEMRAQLSPEPRSSDASS